VLKSIIDAVAGVGDGQSAARSTEQDVASFVAGVKAAANQR
jgi:hypothetical protein